MQYAIVELCCDDNSYVTNAAIFETELTDPEQILMAYVPFIKAGSGTNVLCIFLEGHQYVIEDTFYRSEWKFYDYG